MGKPALPPAAGSSTRRSFIRNTGILAMATAAGLPLLTIPGCKGEQDEEVTPTEDLMREHGILNRVLLVYDHFLQLLQSGTAINPQWIGAAADIIKHFIEDYHERQEEDFLFPRFEQAGKLTDLIVVLRTQHRQGRLITDNLLQLSRQQYIKAETDGEKLTGLLRSFIRMYRPHEAREDTVLFPALRSIVSSHEYDSLGEEFEKNEHKQFGEGGFGQFVEKVAALERQLGIYDLAQFTPAL